MQFMCLKKVKKKELLFVLGFEGVLRTGLLKLLMTL
jgi:hypothetical protein